MFVEILLGSVICLFSSTGGRHSNILQPEKKPAAKPIDIEKILADLQNGDANQRIAAANQLKDISSQDVNISTQTGLKILQLAVQAATFDKPDPGETSSDLLALLADHPQAEYVPVVVRDFQQFPEPARASALSLVAEVESREAAEAYMKIFRTYGKSGKIPDAAVEPFKSKPRYAEILFPELLGYATNPKLSFDIYQLCLEYCEAGLLKRETLAPYSEQILESYRTQSRELWPLQQPDGISWMWHEEYVPHRNEAALLLDLMGYFPPEKVLVELGRGLRYRDPRLKYFVISSLLRLGQPVNAGQIEMVAAYDEMRNYMYDRLKQAGKDNFFPKKYRNQEAFAESNMVDWLAYPTELGRAPDEIELMKVETRDLGSEEGLCDYYLYRFRVHAPHEMATEGWLASVAGPFRQKEMPTTNALGHTFSAFEKWDSRKPEEHLQHLLDLVDEQTKGEGKDG
jgi:hypothetical protein